MSVADTLRAEQRMLLATLGVEQRIKLAFELGDRDTALYAATHAVPASEARRVLATRRSLGRQRSVSART